MNPLFNIFLRGFLFAQNNPQIIYTLFLVVMIPSAFFFTSEQFLRIARENQDLFERNRIGILQDVFVLFAKEHVDDASYLSTHIQSIVEQNETVTRLQVMRKNTSSEFIIVASKDDVDVGTPFVPDPLSSALFSNATGRPGESFAAKFFTDGVRYWRSVRAITDASSTMPVAYVLTDVSMAEADAVARKNIRSAYLVLALIIFLIIVLLARQARIIDYATLYQKLKEVDHMKDDFVSMAAHELRSPLSIIRGYTEMLADGEKLSPGGQTNLKHIDDAAVHLNHLIGDILDVAKLQEGRMSFRFESRDVSKDIAEVVESFMRVASDKGLKLSYENISLPLISIDPDRFHQVMINLVGNAIKYTPSGEVRVITSQEKESVVVRVSDTGMGISAEDQQKLFQKFYRVKSEETSTITGTGLGLWITSQMVKTMHGDIAVESIKGKGTDFILRFPVIKESPTA
ncbi:MAG: hypothetical protein A2494_02405 [Candidatus Lloydbacteria bacterium RIFOXYC12_FULL_46_25]|uniref:histidine kinase n=1 Tax=Candidatus Lloydbacteria bacterium RIFOXYC12_FULL_46_25 TaxID=1798670 RepID=A0A1G2DV84_9BACT|nr:MAG: hypothetical protein A2494_02405 [Candidatus Lloydbacteria bacterium RIFOXYC12_FULL_46_25]